MPADVRSAIINETRRVLKDSGRLLLIDYHPGPIRSLKGWVGKGMIFVIEKAAGRDHYKNFCQFIGSQGLPGLIGVHELQVDTKKIVNGGNLALFLLRPK